MPWSITLMMVCSTVLMIVRPPGLPVTINSVPSRVTMVGVMLEIMRLPGAARLGSVPTSPDSVVSPGPALKSPISLFSRNPAPGTTMREP
jgi:hypothetical protein